MEVDPKHWAAVKVPPGALGRTTTQASESANGMFQFLRHLAPTHMLREFLRLSYLRMVNEKKKWGDYLKISKKRDTDMKKLLTNKIRIDEVVKENESVWTIICGNPIVEGRGTNFDNEIVRIEKFSDIQYASTCTCGIPKVHGVPCIHLAHAVDVLGIDISFFFSPELLPTWSYSFWEACTLPKLMPVRKLLASRALTAGNQKKYSIIFVAIK